MAEFNRKPSKGRAGGGEPCLPYMTTVGGLESSNEHGYEQRRLC